jgi:hypothetical protein
LGSDREEKAVTDDELRADDAMAEARMIETNAGFVIDLLKVRKVCELIWIRHRADLGLRPAPTPKNLHLQPDPNVPGQTLVVYAGQMIGMFATRSVIEESLPDVRQ